MTARSGERGLGPIHRVLARSLGHFKVMFGGLEIFAGSDFLFVEQLIAILIFLSEFEFGLRRSNGILIVRKCFEIVSLGLIDVG